MAGPITNFNQQAMDQQRLIADMRMAQYISAAAHRHPVPPWDSSPSRLWPNSSRWATASHPVAAILSNNNSLNGAKDMEICPTPRLEMVDS